MDWDLAGQYSKQWNDSDDLGYGIGPAFQASVDDGSFDPHAVNTPFGPGQAAVAQAAAAALEEAGGAAQAAILWEIELPEEPGDEEDPALQSLYAAIESIPPDRVPEVVRAFSLFLFNDAGELLLQQRAPGKRLWGGFWSNSCCSHPRKGEPYDRAAHRRLREELGVEAELHYLYQFKYSAAFQERGSERELCAVFLGRLDSDCEIAVNPNEIADWRWVSCNDLDYWVRDAPEHFTPWFMLEWSRLRTDKRQDVLRLCQGEIH